MKTLLGIILWGFAVLLPNATLWETMKDVEWETLEEEQEEWTPSLAFYLIANCILQLAIIIVLFNKF